LSPEDSDCDPDDQDGDDEYYANFGGLSDDFFGDSSLDNFGMEADEEATPTSEADVVKYDEEKIDHSNPLKDPVSPPLPIRSGSLDWFFEASEREEIEHSSEITEKFEKKLAELTVQETLAILLHAGAVKKRDKLLEEYNTAVLELENYEGEADDVGNGIEKEGLKADAEKIGSQLQLSMRTVSDLSESCRRISSRVLDYASFQNREFQTNSVAIEKLEALLDEQAAFVQGIGEMEYLDMQFQEEGGGDGQGSFATKGGTSVVVTPNTTGTIDGRTIFSKNDILADSGEFD